MDNERRLYRRIQRETPCNYEILGEDGRIANQKRNGLIINISTAGLCFQAEERIAVDTPIYVEFVLGDMYQGPYRECVFRKPVKMHGRVIWSGPAPTVEDSYLMGIEFLGSSGLETVQSKNQREETCQEKHLLQRLLPGRLSVSPPRRSRRNRTDPS